MFLLSAAALATVTCPLFTFLVGRGFQSYHFENAAVIAGYAALAVGAYFINALLERWGAASLASTLLCMIAIAGVVHGVQTARYTSADERPTLDAMRMDERTAPNDYRSAFSALVEELKKGRYKEDDVLGTLDSQVADWWLYRGKYLYLVDANMSLASDAMMEDRFLSFCALLHVGPEDFSSLIQQQYVLMRVLGGEKYQASSAYTFAPLDDYDPETQRLIRISSVFDNWQLALPISEQRRLVESYMQRVANKVLSPLPDLIVLSMDGRRELFHPTTGRFALVYENERFEVWDKLD